MRGITVKGSLSAGMLGNHYRKCKNMREKTRWHALWLVKTGMPARKTAKVIGSCERSVRSWVHNYNQKGPEALKSRQIPGRKPKLNAKQTIQIDKLIQSQPPFSNRWTLKLLRWKIRDEFATTYTLSGVWYLIRRRLFRLKVPRPYNPKADKALQENFKKKRSNQ